MCKWLIGVPPPTSLDSLDNQEPIIVLCSFINAEYLTMTSKIRYDSELIIYVNDIYILWMALSSPV